MPKLVLDENTKALEFYRIYREIADVTEKIDIVMGRKQVYKYTSSSTQNCKINYHAIPTAKSYKIKTTQDWHNFLG